MPGMGLPSWDDSSIAAADELDTLVYLSNLIGGEEWLVQPGGGNISVKIGEHLFVKGSGTDLRTIKRVGFTQLSLPALNALVRPGLTMTDADMMSFMARCMADPKHPVPSVETPLHSLLPARVILHTHDIPTMALTNVPGGDAARALDELFHGALVLVPYARPGFPLSCQLAGMVADIPADAIGLALAHHGLVVWGDSAKECYQRLADVTGHMLAYLDKHHVPSPSASQGCHCACAGVHLDEPQRRHVASLVMPVIRGFLSESITVDVPSTSRAPFSSISDTTASKPQPAPPPAHMPAAQSRLHRVVLNLDDSTAVLDALATPGFKEWSGRGMATPEHILRAGRVPLWVDLPAEPLQAVLAGGGVDVVDKAEARLREHVGEQLVRQRREYLEYHARNSGWGGSHHGTGEVERNGHGRGGDDTVLQPLQDWAKVVLVPGVGLITGFRDKKSATVAAACYRATLAAILHASSFSSYATLPEAQAFEFEHWPLERRKLDAAAQRERESNPFGMARHVALVVGGGSGIGEATARRFAAEGAHVVVADVELASADRVAAALNAAHGAGRALPLAVDVGSDDSIEDMARAGVLAYGGVDTLVYSAGRAPRFASVTGITRGDLQAQLDVHYIGAVRCMGALARVFTHQGLGGNIIASVSKAAVAPGKEAVAYGSSKAALLQAVRVAAVEMGAYGIRVNAINADQVETPLFMRFVQERSAARGISCEEQLAIYQKRNVMGVGLIPAEACADAAVLLASPRMAYTTGDIITIDGGLPEAFPR